MGGSKLDANTYLKWITFKCKSTSSQHVLGFSGILELVEVPVSIKRV